MNKLREKLHEIIFEAETTSGKIFDVALLIAIVISILIVIFDSVDSVHTSYGNLFLKLEWLFTIVFTLEYAVRLYCVKKPLQYAKSFFGIIDFLAILPTYLSLVFGGVQSLLVIRALRLLRLFRILKLARFSSEAEILVAAVRASRPKITVFLGTVITIVVVMGAVMHLVEGGENGFADIPSAMYWAIVTLTTVGYGHVVPQTILGKAIAAMIMVLGYGLIAVPTGIVSVELAHASKLSVSTRSCPHCSKEGHDLDAVYCRFCSNKLD